MSRIGGLAPRHPRFIMLVSSSDTLLSDFVCGFDFRHSLRLPFAAILSVLKGLIIHVLQFLCLGQLNVYASLGLPFAAILSIWKGLIIHVLQFLWELQALFHLQITLSRLSKGLWTMSISSETFLISILEGLNYTKFSISLREPKLRSDVLYKKEKNIQSYSLFQSKLNQNCFRLKMKPNISKIILIVFSFKSFQSNQSI